MTVRDTDAELDTARRDAIERLLVDKVAELLALEPGDVDPRAPHSSYGLDSASAVLLAAELEEELGVSLPDSLAWDHPTLRSLADWLAEAPDVSGADAGGVESP